MLASLLSSFIFHCVSPPGKHAAKHLLEVSEFLAARDFLQSRSRVISVQLAALAGSRPYRSITVQPGLSCPAREPSLVSKYLRIYLSEHANQTKRSLLSSALTGL